MRAVIVATGLRIQCGGVPVGTLAELLPLAGKPLVQRSVELLADRGFRELRFLLFEEPERFRRILGSGERWGVRISTTLCGPGTDPGGFAGPRAAGWEDARLFDCLDIPFDSDAPGPDARSGASDPRGAFTLSTYLALALGTIDGSLRGSVVPGRERERGVRLSHHVSVHRNARLVPPVYLADGVEVGPDAVVGPGAVLERGVIVGAGTTISGSVVLPWTMLGSGLGISDALVDGGAVYKPRDDAAIVLDDPLLARSWRERRYPAAVGERTAAACVLGLLAPVLLPAIGIAALSGGRPVCRKLRIRSTPDRGPRSSGRTRVYRQPAAFPPCFPLLVSDLVPGLLNVALGGVRLSGLPPRTSAQIDDLPAPHAAVALASPMGLLGEWRCLDPEVTDMERYAVEAWQASGWRYPSLRKLAIDIGRALLRPGSPAGPSAGTGDPPRGI